MFISQCERPSFTHPFKTTCKIVVLYILILIILDSQL
jgi:hypothetical protein